YVAYTSNAPNLVVGFTGPAGGRFNVYLYDRLNGTNTLVSHQFDSATTGSSYDCDYLNMATGGGGITFPSNAVNLVAGFPGFPGTNSSQYYHSYAYDVSSGQIALLDHKYGSINMPGSGNGLPRAVTPDGRYVIVNSYAPDLLSVTSASKGDVY